MGTKTRMPSDERQKLIITRVRELFAHKGLEGATTRELAHAAGVSEGLLFKHFPNKEAIHRAMLASIEAELPDSLLRNLSSEPSTSNLIRIIHDLVSILLSDHPDELDDITRIYLRSLAGDREFAHLVLSKPQGMLIPSLEKNIRAAVASGDLVDSPVPFRLRAWFAERLTFILMADLLPPTPVIDYGIAGKDLVREVVWFLLRGIGLKEEVIRHYYTEDSRILHED